MILINDEPATLADYVRHVLHTPERPTLRVNLVTTAYVWLLASTIGYSEDVVPDAWTTLEGALGEVRRSLILAQETAPATEPTIEVEEDTERIVVTLGESRFTLAKSLLNHRPYADAESA